MRQKTPSGVITACKVRGQGCWWWWFFQVTLVKKVQFCLDLNKHRPGLPCPVFLLPSAEGARLEATSHACASIQKQGRPCWLDHIRIRQCLKQDLHFLPQQKDFCPHRFLNDHMIQKIEEVLSDFHLYLTFPLYRKLLLRIVNRNMLVLTHFRLKRCLYLGRLVQLFENSIAAHNNEV